MCLGHKNYKWRRLKVVTQHGGELAHKKSSQNCNYAQIQGTNKMKRKNLVLLLIGLVMILGFLSYITFPYLWKPNIKSEETPFDIAYEFATALRLNDPVAYELSDSELWPRLDQWMEMHEVPKCIQEFDEQFIGGTRVDGKHDINYRCRLANGRYQFEVLNIHVEKQEDILKIVDWSEDVEEFPSE